MESMAESKGEERSPKYLEDGLKWTFKQESMMSKTPWNAQTHMHPEKQRLWEQWYNTSIDAIEEVNHTLCQVITILVFWEEEDFRRVSSNHKPERAESNDRNIYLQMESSRSIQNVMRKGQGEILTWWWVTTHMYLDDWLVTTTTTSPFHQKHKAQHNCAYTIDLNCYYHLDPLKS